MGAEYHCYCSDITSSFPANGVFTPDQRQIYQAVLDATEAVEANIKPGCDWGEMHRLAWRIMMQALLEMGVLTGDLEALIAARVPELFMVSGRFHILCGRFDWDLPTCCVFLSRNDGVETPGAGVRARAPHRHRVRMMSPLTPPLPPPPHPTPSTQQV
jgi:hypothetical protein